MPAILRSICSEEEWFPTRPSSGNTYVDIMPVSILGARIIDQSLDGSIPGR